MAKNCFSLVKIWMLNISIDDKVGTALVDFVGNQKNLKVLELGQNSIKDILATGIFENLSKKCSSLRELLVESIGMTSKMKKSIIDFLEKQENLQNIHLNSNKIGNILGKELFQRLSLKCKSMEEIELENIGLNEMIDLSIVNFIGIQENLKILKLNNNKLGDNLLNKLFKKLLVYCKSLETLSLSKVNMTENIDREICLLIGKQKNIAVVNLNFNNFGNRIISASCVKLAKHCTSLINISFENTNIDDGSISYIVQAIRQQKNLEVLNLSSNDLLLEEKKLY